MMKKIKCLFVGTLIVCSMPIGVLAQEDQDTAEVAPVTTASTIYADENVSEPVLIAENTDKTTLENPVEVIKEDEKNIRNEKSKSNKFDGQIRSEYMFVSLANRLDLQIESAKVIAMKADELGKEVDFSEVLSNFEMLEQNARNFEYDLEAEPQVTKVEFDLIKEQAKELTQEFRELSKDLFTQEEKDSIKEVLKEIKKVNHESHKEEVEKMKNAIYLKNTIKFLDRLGVDSSEILTKIESGEISEDEIKSALKELMKSSKDNKRNELVKKYKEDKVKDRIYDNDKRDEIKEKIKSREKELNEKFKERKDKLNEEFRDHKEKLEKLKNENKESYEKLRNSFKEKEESFKRDEKKRMENKEGEVIEE